MTLLTAATGALVALTISVLLTPLVTRFARSRKCLDQPDGKRKEHSVPTPTLGGIAIVAAVSVGGTYLVGMAELSGFSFPVPSWGLWSGALVVVGAGILDDLRGLDPKTKFLLQLIAAYLLLLGGHRVELSGFSFLDNDPYQLALITIPVTMVWVVGIINAVNLLDGLDGLAAGVGLIAFSCFAAIFGLHGDTGSLATALVLCGAIGGFLFYNFNPASVFMGDSGSLFLGYMLAAYSLDLSASAGPTMSLLVPVVALGVPITDTTVSILRRFLSGKAIFAPDRDHIHHRLRTVLSHRGSVLILYLVGLWFGVAAFLMATLPAYFGYGVLGVVVVTVVVSLRVLGYLQVQEMARGLRYRVIMLQRSQVINQEEPDQTTPEEREAPSDNWKVQVEEVQVEEVHNGHASSKQSEPTFI